jgi:hypothetical protein
MRARPVSLFSNSSGEVVSVALLALLLGLAVFLGRGLLDFFEITEEFDDLRQVPGVYERGPLGVYPGFREALSLLRADEPRQGKTCQVSNQPFTACRSPCFERVLL